MASWRSLALSTLSLPNAHRAVNGSAAMVWSATTSHSVHAFIWVSSPTSELLSAATLSPVYPAACASANSRHEGGELAGRVDDPARSVDLRDARDPQRVGIDVGRELRHIAGMRILRDIHDSLAERRAFGEVRRGDRGELIRPGEDPAHVVVRAHPQELEPNTAFALNRHHSSIP